MSRSLPAAFLARLQDDATRLVLCWRVERGDGVVIRGTSHDRVITISGAGSPTNPHAGRYRALAAVTGSSVRSTTELDVDNLEVEGTTADGLTITDLTAADIEAGLLDDAYFVVFLAFWDDPDIGQCVLRAGNLGNIKRTSEGAYTAELRGLLQRLSQGIVRTYGVQCDADLGDSRCGVNLAALTLTGTVTAVTNRRRFSVAITSGSPTPSLEYFDGGLLTVTSGESSGYAREVKRGAVGGVLGEVELFEALPLELEVGNTVSMRPGCDKSAETCRVRFSNLARFRGYGLFVPGQNAVLRGPE